MKKITTYEQASARLEEIVKALEKGDLSLDKSLELYEEGNRLVAYCTDILNKAEQKVTVIRSDASNESFVEVPFDSEEEA